MVLFDRINVNARHIRIGCGVLFACFVGHLLFHDLDGLLIVGLHHFSVDTNLDSVSGWGAAVIFFLFFVLQYHVARFGRFPLHLYALSYVPSSLALILFLQFLLASFTPGASISWGWLVGLLVFAVVWFMCAKPKDSRRQSYTCAERLILPNLLISLLLMLGIGVGSLPSAEMWYVFKNQSILEEDMSDDILLVGEKSLLTNDRLVAFRAHALSRQGLLGERLFRYPQTGRPGSLVLSWNDTLDYNTTPFKIFRHLGAAPRRGMSAPAYVRGLLPWADKDSLSRLQHRDAADYGLCALLLERKLDDFVRWLPAFYTVCDTLPDGLPQHYREALTIYCRTHSNPVVEWNQEVDIINYADFHTLWQSYPNRQERVNATRKEFGTTYYWYFYSKGK